MLFNINYENFLLYAIDYFKREELLDFTYVIVSAIIPHRTSKLPVNKIYKLSSIFPPCDIVSLWMDGYDDGTIKTKYYDYLKDSNVIRDIVTSVAIEHKNIVIICKKEEDYFINIICDFIYDEFKLPSINLNSLFTKGGIYVKRYNRNKIMEAIKNYEREQKKLFIKNSKADIKSDNLYIKTQAINAMSIKDVKKSLKKFNINTSNMTDEQMREALKELSS